MDITSTLQRLSLKSALENDQKDAYFLDNSLMLGLESKSKPVLVVVNPANTYTNNVGQRITFKLPRYNFCGKLELAFDLDAITAFGGDADLVRNGYVRPVGALVDRLEISYGSYTFHCPPDFLAHFPLVYYSEDQLEKKKRSAGFKHGIPAHGTNRTGGSFFTEIPVPWLNHWLPLGALSGEMTVTVWFKGAGKGYVETSYGGRSLPVVGSTASDQSVNDGLGNAASVTLANVGQNITAYGITATVPAALTITSPRLYMHAINVSDELFSTVIEKVKTAGMAIPALDIGFVDAANYEAKGNTQPNRINLTQISGLCYALLVSIRDADKIDTADGSHSILKTYANSKDITMAVEINGQRLYATEPIPLLKSAELIADAFKCSNMDKEAGRYVLAGFPFCVDADKSLRNNAQTGYVDLTNSSSSFLTLYMDAAKTLHVQVRALMHTYLIVDKDGLRRINM